MWTASFTLRGIDALSWMLAVALASFVRYNFVFHEVKWAQLVVFALDREHPAGGERPAITDPQRGRRRTNKPPSLKKLRPVIFPVPIVTIVPISPPREDDTVIGPLYFAYGHTFNGDSALYLFLGRPTERSRGN